MSLFPRLFLQIRILLGLSKWYKFSSFLRLNVSCQNWIRRMRISYLRQRNRSKTWSKWYRPILTHLPINRKATWFTNWLKKALSLFLSICSSIPLTTSYSMRWKDLSITKLSLAIGHVMKRAKEVLYQIENILYWPELVKYVSFRSYLWEKLSLRTKQSTWWCWRTSRSSTKSQK